MKGIRIMDDTTTTMVPHKVSEVQVYKHPAFGQVRMLVENGKRLTCALDAAKALQYANPYDALDLHCRSLAKREVPHPQSKTKTIEMNFIPDGDLYRLIAHSHMPGAEQFESWIFDDIVPTVVETGTYTAPGAASGDNDKLLRAQAMERNSRTKQASLLFKMSNYDRLSPEAAEVLMLEAAQICTGKPISYRPTMPETKYYSATDIAQEIEQRSGITISRAALGKLANDAGIKTDQYGKTVLRQGEHNKGQYPTFEYNEAGKNRMIALVLGTNPTGVTQ